MSTDFRCRECGSHVLIETMENVTVSSECSIWDGEMDYGEQTNTDGEVIGYQCEHGHNVMTGPDNSRRVTTEEELLEYCANSVKPWVLGARLYEPIAPDVEGIPAQEPRRVDLIGLAIRGGDPSTITQMPRKIWKQVSVWPPSATPVSEIDEAAIAQATKNDAGSIKWAYIVVTEEQLSDLSILFSTSSIPENSP